MTRHHNERGQAVLLVIVAMGIFLLGALGLAVDSSTLFFQRQMAQAAADASAMAAIMTMFQGTNIVGKPEYFVATPGSSFNCGVNDAKIPCKYAGYHGFRLDGRDTVHVSFATATGGYYSDEGSASNSVTVTITRPVQNTLIRMVGAGPTTDIKATATAAVVQVVSPIPILVLHPTNPNALYMNGNLALKICGGPDQSIQVNSRNPNPYQMDGGSTINLLQAGPGTTVSADCGSWPHGDGADFGVFGPKANPGASVIKVGSGDYIQPSSPIEDPLKDVYPSGPPRPANAGTITPLANGVYGCDFAKTNGKPCHLYTPGYYTDGISVGPNDMALFTPGFYYMDSGKGFSTKSNGAMAMCVGCPNSPSTDPNILDGMVVYNDYTGGSTPTFDIQGGGDVSLKGAPTNGIWKGILFYQDHTSPATTHIIGGNGCLQLEGTLYATNTYATMINTASHYQTIQLHGTPCSTTYFRGMIITDSLDLRGNSDLRMLLDSDAVFKVRQVALVK